MSAAATAQDVLDFWFGALPLTQRAEWFKKDPAFDDTIRRRFGALVETALAQGLPWNATPHDRLAQLIVLDHAPADRHLDAIISPTLFSLRTNRKIFRGLVHLADLKGWQETMRMARERSRWMLTDDEVERHLAVAYDYIMETLRSEAGRARELDPTGHRPLDQAKRLRRKELVSGGWADRGHMLEAAGSHFGLPEHPLEYWLDSTVTRPWLLPTPPELVTVPESVILGAEDDSAD